MLEMQDIYSIGGSGGRFPGGGSDRRLRPHHQNHQPLKCPRCDSLNTKFCYYNNYNLSQPRHFCKSCRRYWTKGGVLRNVPVGGGCRKSKRSKPKSAADAPSREHKSNSSSSGESSSLTANTTPAKTSAAAAEVLSARSSDSPATLINFPESRFFSFQNTNLSFDAQLIGHPSDGGILPEIGSFTSLMTSESDAPPPGMNVVDIAQNQSLNQVWYDQQKITSSSNLGIGDLVKMQEIAGQYEDRTAEIEFSKLPNREGNGGFAPMDWPGCGDQGLFDLTANDDQSYWSEQTEWVNNNQHFDYIP